MTSADPRIPPVSSNLRVGPAFETANSTVQLFLGGRQPSWMQSSGGVPTDPTRLALVNNPNTTTNLSQDPHPANRQNGESLRALAPIPSTQPNVTSGETRGGGGGGGGGGGLISPVETPPQHSATAGSPNNPPPISTNPIHLIHAPPLPNDQALPSPGPSSGSRTSPAGLLDGVDDAAACTQNNTNTNNTNASLPPVQSQPAVASMVMPPAVPVNETASSVGSLGVRMDKSFWADCRAKLGVLRAQGPGSMELSESVELPRVRLLEEACEAEDLVYVVLHQVFCFYTFAPSQCFSLPGIGPKQAQGLGIFKLLLLDNRCLTGDFLKWCISFPYPLPLLQQLHPEPYATVMQTVSTIFAMMAERWGPYDQLVKRRGYPPIVEELAVSFQMSSLVLMSIVFRAKCRVVYGRGYESLAARLRNLFDHDWRAYISSLNKGADAQPPRDYDSLIRTYLAMSRELPPSSIPRQLPQQSPQQVMPISLPDLQTTNIIRPVQPAAQTPIVAQAQSPATAVSTSSARPSPIAFPPQGAPRPLQHPIPVAFNQLQSPQTHNSPTVRAEVPQVTARVSLSSPAAAPRARPRGRGRPSLRGGHQPIRADVAVQNSTRESRTSAAPRRGTRRGRGQAPPVAIVPHTPTSSQPQQARNHPPLHPPLLPQPGFVQHNPPRSSLHAGLHQAHLRDPLCKLVQRGPTGDEETGLFQYVRGFAVPPCHLGQEACSFEWTVSVSSEERMRFPNYLPNEGGHRPVRLLLEGCLLYRLRCIKVSPAMIQFDHLAWSVAETTWPSAIYVFINGVEHYVRRKVHNGKDLALDITDGLRQGMNQVSIHLLRSPAEQQDVFYAAGVEVLDVASLAFVKQLVRTIPAAQSCEEIRRRLSSSVTDGDDDLAVVNDHLSIDLLDPFMARIFNVPARGSACTHRECFDLDTYLMTRMSKSGKDGLKENWKCPICNLDARPQNLIIDGFLAAVHAELQRTNRLGEAKAIKIKADGSWELQQPRQLSSEHPASSSSSSSSSSAGAKRKRMASPTTYKTESSSTNNSTRGNSLETAVIIELE